MKLKDAYPIEQQIKADNSAYAYRHADFVGNGATEMFFKDVLGKLTEEHGG